MAEAVTDRARWYEDSDGVWVALRVEGRPRACELAAVVDKPCTVTVKPRRKRRSMDANAYYRVLCGKLAQACDTSMNQMHNLMMRRYGTPLIIDGALLYTFLPDTEDAKNTALEMETLHLKPTTSTKDGTDGTRYRAYYVIKGSHEYDTKEMSALISGIVSECKECGIETMPPEELQSLMEAWR